MAKPALLLSLCAKERNSLVRGRAAVGPEGPFGRRQAKGYVCAHYLQTQGLGQSPSRVQGQRPGGVRGSAPRENFGNYELNQIISYILKTTRTPLLRSKSRNEILYMVFWSGRSYGFSCFPSCSSRFWNFVFLVDHNTHTSSRSMCVVVDK